MRLWAKIRLMAVMAIAVMVWSVVAVNAARIDVSAGSGSLMAAVLAAQSGDTLVLSTGRYEGRVVIAKPLKIEGNDRAIIVGDDQGTVIIVDAPDVEIRKVMVTGSGLLLETQDSGIFLTPKATNARIEGVFLYENLIGVYVSGATNALVSNNMIVGRSDLPVNERGNGVQIWNADGTIIENNEITAGRDGIFVTVSRRNIYRNNLIHDLRFAVHYMYTNKSQVINNYSYGNHIGYAIMFSTTIGVHGNTSKNDRERGILLNYVNDAEFSDNIVMGRSKKCFFVYNSNKNQIFNNYFSGCAIGIQFTAGSERNVIYNNAFVDNRRQVKYVGTRWQEWSFNAKGNYWSDSSAFDLDANGIGDVPYRPNDLTDQIIWRYPVAKLLLSSPVIQILKWIQREFPAVYPGGIVDSYPLMAVPEELARQVEARS